MKKELCHLHWGLKPAAPAEASCVKKCSTTWGYRTLLACQIWTSGLCTAEVGGADGG